LGSVHPIILEYMNYYLEKALFKPTMAVFDAKISSSGKEIIGLIMANFLEATYKHCQSGSVVRP